MIVLTQNGVPLALQGHPTKDDGAAAANNHPTNDNKPNASIVADHSPSDKEFSTVSAQFALLGHELKRRKYPGGRTLFEVGRWGQCRQFSAWHDVIGFLAQIGG